MYSPTAGWSALPETELRDCCGAVVAITVTPDLDALRNLVVFEVARLPELVPAWRDGGVWPLMDALATSEARALAEFGEGTAAFLRRAYRP